MVQILSTMVLISGTKVSQLFYHKFHLVLGTSALYRRLPPMPVTVNYFNYQLFVPMSVTCQGSDVSH